VRWVQRPSCLFLLPGLSLLVSACMTVGPDYVAPKPQVPAKFAEAPASMDTLSQQTADDAWWKNLGDPVLERLVQQALESAPDIAAAQARVREARALSGFAQSDLRNPAGRVSARTNGCR